MHTYRGESGSRVADSVGSSGTRGTCLVSPMLGWPGLCAPALINLLDADHTEEGGSL